MVELVITLHHFCNDWAFAVNPKTGQGSFRQRRDLLTAEFQTGGSKSRTPELEKTRGIVCACFLVYRNLGHQGMAGVRTQIPRLPGSGLAPLCHLIFSMGEEGVRCDRGTRGTPGSESWLPIASPWGCVWCGGHGMVGTTLRKKSNAEAFPEDRDLPPNLTQGDK